MSACPDLWWMTESDINRCKYQIWAVIGVGWLEISTVYPYRQFNNSSATQHTDANTHARRHA